jgi:hypothetical protein
MPLIGQDFLPSQPTEGDFVRRRSGVQMASTLRSLKDLVKQFFGRSFDTDSGDLKSDIMPSSALRTLSPNPTGTYRRMEVNKKGQITGGSSDPLVFPPRLFRAIFIGSSSAVSTVDEEDGSVAVTGQTIVSPQNSEFVRPLPYNPPLTSQQFTFYQFLFTVPKKVQRVDFLITGGSPFVQPNGSWVNDPYLTRIGSMRVSGGQVLRVFTGLDAVSPSRICNFEKTVYSDNTQVQSGVTEVFKLSTSPWTNGFGGVSGKPSLVLIEWYA